ncbi:MAG: twin-arginine translocase TatA/TatE family subunit [Brevefilum sp.]|jgi:sec-independent protein translocase protein TatA
MLGRSIGWPELLVILVIVVLVFGVGRISKIAGEIGSGIRAFKDGLAGKIEEDHSSDPDESQDDHPL